LGKRPWLTSLVCRPRDGINGGSVGSEQADGFSEFIQLESDVQVGAVGGFCCVSPSAQTSR